MYQEPTGLELIIERLKANDPTLTKADLWNKQIGDKEATALASALASNTTLTTLVLSYNRIGSVGAIALAEALKLNTTLTEIYLGQNQIDIAGAKALANALKLNTTLTTITLQDNEIDDAGAKTLASALEHNTTLTEICLQRDIMGDGGTGALKHIRLITIRNKGIKQLRDTEIQNIKVATIILANITENAAQQIIVGATTGVMADLAALLHNEDADIKTHTAIILGNLAKTSANKSLIIERPEVIINLLELLDDSNPNVRGLAAVALCHLTDSDLNRIKTIDAAKVISNVAALLGHRKDVIKRKAAITLQNLALNNDVNKATIVQTPNAVENLVALLGNLAREVKCSAAAALRSIVSDTEVSEINAEDFASLTPASATTDSMLWDVLTKDDAREIVAQTPSALERLVTLLYSEDAETRKHAVYTLRDLSQTKANIAAIAEYREAITSIEPTTLINASDPSTIEAAEALANIQATVSAYQGITGVATVFAGAPGLSLSVVSIGTTIDLR